MNGPLYYPLAERRKLARQRQFDVFIPVQDFRYRSPRMLGMKRVRPLRRRNALLEQDQVHRFRCMRIVHAMQLVQQVRPLIERKRSRQQKLLHLRIGCLARSHQTYVQRPPRTLEYFLGIQQRHCRFGLLQGFEHEI